MRLIRPLRTCVVLTIVFGGEAMVGTQRLDPEAIVDRYWPTSRVERSAHRSSCHAVMAKTPGGEPSRIAAGYWDGSNAVLRVLDREGPGRFRVSFESADLDGFICQIKTLDVTGDGRDDILIELAQRADVGLMRVFRAVGPTFEDLTGSTAALPNVSVFDLDHTGALEMVSSVMAETDGHTRYWSRIYRYQGSGLILDGEAPVVSTFAPRRSLRDIFERRWFSPLDDAPRGYLLRVINGRRGGRGRATRVTITINGEQVVAADRLTADVEFIDIPLSAALKPENELHVVVTGAADAEVTIVIQPREGRANRTLRMVAS